MIEWARRAGYSPSDLDKLRVIHVTGTKGKGSVCAFVQAILAQYPAATGNKTGLYTSPHLKSVRERIRINGEPISKDLFTKYFFELFDRLSSSTSDLSIFPEFAPGIKPNYFRFLTLLSFHVFLSEGVKCAIYEVGIGGEYDSTNIVPHPVATGVTSLGIDHTNMLGNTIEEIAWNKGGIYKSSALALSVPQSPAALKVLEDRAREKNTPFVVLDPNTSPVRSLKLGLPARFQYINATLAVGLAKQFLLKSTPPIPDLNIDPNSPLPEKFIKGLETASWPGRCQTVSDGPNLTWFLDGAHTHESITETGLWFKTVVSPKANHRVLIFNQQKRDAGALAETLYNAIGSDTPSFDHVVFCTNVTWASGQYSAELTSINTSATSVDSLIVQKGLADAWAKIDPSSQRHIFPSIQEAVEFVKALDGQTQVLVTGSLHLVGGLLAVFDGPDEEE